MKPQSGFIKYILFTTFSFLYAHHFTFFIIYFSDDTENVRGWNDLPRLEVKRKKRSKDFSQGHEIFRMTLGMIRSNCNKGKALDQSSMQWLKEGSSTPNYKIRLLSKRVEER